MSTYINQLLKNFEETVTARAWKGSQHPNDHEFIENDYRHAKRALKNRIVKLEEENGRLKRKGERK